MSTFGSAFSSARKAGKKTFSWNGKSYTTKLKSGSSALPKKTTAVPSDGAVQRMQKTIETNATVVDKMKSGMDKQVAADARPDNKNAGGPSGKAPSARKKFAMTTGSKIRSALKIKIK